MATFLCGNTQTTGPPFVENEIPPSPKSTNRSLLVGFAIRLGVWILVISGAIANYSVAPRVEQFLADRGIDVPWGVVLAWRALHLVHVYFIFFALWVIVDGVGLLALARTKAGQSAGKNWSRLMWAPLFLLLGSILLGAFLGVLQVLIKIASR